MWQRSLSLQSLYQLQGLFSEWDQPFAVELAQRHFQQRVSLRVLSDTVEFERQQLPDRSRAPVPDNIVAGAVQIVVRTRAHGLYCLFKVVRVHV